MTQIVFAHGWASGDFVWDQIKPAFNEDDVHTINIGFMGDEDVSIPDGQFIGVGHSLGGLWLMKHYPDQMRGFVSIASFNCFYTHVSGKILKIMQRGILQDTAKELSEFWYHAGLDHPSGFLNVNPVKLVEGLVWLSQWDADIPDIPLKILAARNDHIVPKEMTHDIWKDYDIEWRDDGGHMLPLTQAEWCIQHIKEFIDAL